MNQGGDEFVSAKPRLHFSDGHMYDYVRTYAELSKSCS